MCRVIVDWSIHVKLLWKTQELRRIHHSAGGKHPEQDLTGEPQYRYQLHATGRWRSSVDYP